MATPPCSKRKDETCRKSSPHSPHPSSSITMIATMMPPSRSAPVARTHQSCHNDGPYVPASVEILPTPKDHVASPRSEFPKHHNTAATSSSSSSTSFSTPSRPSAWNTARTPTTLKPILQVPLIRASAAIAVSSTTTTKHKNNSIMSVRDQLSSEGSKAPTSQIDTPSSSKKKRKRSASKELGQSSGRWTRAEHEAFLVGLKECGREWKKVAMRIPTRTSAQIRSHAQKYFAKIQRDQDSMVVDTTHHHLVAPVVATSPNVTPSVARNIERILADPMAAQQEVQNTMEALRERYRQLQLRLGRRQQNHLSSLGRLVEPEDSIKQRSIDALQQQMMDDHSSVSSNVSSAVASLANEELIALHVLGETLSRGGENNSSVATAEALPEDEARGETNHKEESRKN